MNLTCSSEIPDRSSTFRRLNLRLYRAQTVERNSNCNSCALIKLIYVTLHEGLPFSIKKKKRRKSEKEEGKKKEEINGSSNRDSKYCSKVKYNLLASHLFRIIVSSCRRKVAELQLPKNHWKS